MDIDSGIYEFANIVPVLKVSRAPVNFVDHDAMRDAKPQQSQHLAECWASLLRRAFLLLKPANDFQALPFRVPGDCIPLFRERYSSFSLSGCRNPGVGEYLAHGYD